LRSLKKKLQENLSLSSKLFLRELLAASARTAKSLVNFPARLAKRFINTGKHSAETPHALTQMGLSQALLTAAKPEPIPGDVSIKNSIVIPVFNKAEFTFQCLEALRHEIDLTETEIIVVDNGSTDQTQAVLAHFENIVRVVSNVENQGFVDACNQGAAMARGKFLVFLNNDTTVLPGWLDNLVETIESNPAAGAVGSLLLYPNNSIQEAGAIVWQNGEADHYGWGASPDALSFNFAREVDFCSAASLLIRKDVFDSLGGFDRRFAPAYYEDVDLCFGVRSLGYRVIYQPLSRLVHFEGATAGTDTTKGFKRFQVINRQKFVEKWREVLEREHLPSNPKQLVAAGNRNRDRQRIIVFDERVPSPDRDAGSLRMLMILRALAKWSHVIFVPFNRPQSLDYERALWKEGIETANAVDYRQLLKHRKVSAAIVSRPSMGEVFIHRIRRINPNVKIVFDMVDTHFLRLQREYDISGEPAALAEATRYRKVEKELAEMSDVVWCASGEDKLVMQGEVPDTLIEVVPTIHELHDRGKPFDERTDLLFIGSLAHRPNEDAVLFFMRQVYPQLQRLLPDVSLDIIGDNSSPAIAAYNSSDVRIRGYVPDIEPYLRDARVFIAPLRFGAGIKGKVGEAMAHGIPVVTTSIGAEGFGLTHEFDVMLADDPASFATAVNRLYTERELWERVAHNGCLRIEKHFTPEVIAETISRSIREL
jgi:GT2 family glycosyltransferase